MPVFSKFAAAAEVGVGEDSAALGPQDGGGLIEGRFADVKATVAGEKNGIRTIEFQALLVKQKHGDASFVLGGIPDLFDFESGGIELDYIPGPDFGRRPLDVVTEDGGDVVIRFEGEKELRAIPSAGSGADGAKRGKSDRGFEFAAGIEDL